MSLRRPTSAISGVKYSAAPVTMRIRNSEALTQCTVRSTRSNRSSDSLFGLLSGDSVVALMISALKQPARADAR